MAARLKDLARPEPPAKAAPDLPPGRSLEDLSAALEKAFNMTPDDAEAVAGVVVEVFAGEEEVNDEAIDAEVRSLFYTLEGQRLLSFRRIEYENENGEKRRAFFWRMRPEVVEQLSTPEPIPMEEDVYASLPAECWQRGTTSDGATA